MYAKPCIFKIHILFLIYQFELCDGQDVIKSKLHDIKIGFKNIYSRSIKRIRRNYWYPMKTHTVCEF